MSNSPLSLVVLISGSGSNLQAIIDQVHAAANVKANVTAVISNRPAVKGLERASQANIPTETLDHKNFESREDFDQHLSATIDRYQPDIVVLAGFMRILTPAFVEHYAGKLINIHPSLLPKFQGLNTHQRALDAKESEHGCSIHFVTAELDGGPVIAQAAINIEPTDTADSLAKKVQREEHKLYPLCLLWMVEKRLHLERSTVYLDKKALPKTGLRV